MLLQSYTRNIYIQHCTFCLLVVALQGLTEVCLILQIKLATPIENQESATTCTTGGTEEPLPFTGLIAPISRHCDSPTNVAYSLTNGQMRSVMGTTAGCRQRVSNKGSWLVAEAIYRLIDHTYNIYIVKYGFYQIYM